MGVYGQPSGTSSFSPLTSDLLITAYERCGLRATELTTDQCLSGRLSANLVNSRFSNRGVSLWTVDTVPTVFNLVQGVSRYALPSNTILMLDSYIRTYGLAPAANLAPQFSTTAGSPNVTVFEMAHGLSPGQFVQIVIPVAVDALLLLGYYQVTTPITANTFTIVAAVNAVTTVINGGVVPQFVSTTGSATVTVNLPNHGQQVGSQFIVQVQTTVGQVPLFGGYPVTAVNSASQFQINVTYPAGQPASVFENNGQCQIAGQQATGSTADILQYGLSRTDYAGIPQKSEPGRPTTIYFDRQVSPYFTVWPVPDGNGPYQLHVYLQRQIQDVQMQNGETANLPFRFYYAWTCALAADLSISWAPSRFQMLDAVSERALSEAEAADVEPVSLYLSPDFTTYFT